MITPSFARPKIILKQFDDVIRECWSVSIPPDEYSVCENEEWYCNTRKNGSNRSGTYAKGFRPGAIRTGCLGELAFAKLLKLPVDFGYKNKGDGGVDFRLYGVGLDVKVSYCDTYERDHCNRVQVINDRGKRVISKADFYVSGYVEYDDPDNRQAEVIFTGWISRNQLEKANVNQGLSISVDKKTLCYKIQFSDLCDLSNMVEFFSDRMKRGVPR